MKQLNATLYKADGSKESFVLDTKTSLETLQKLVGGYIEVIHIVDAIESLKQGEPVGKDLVINEEGRLLNLPFNPWSYSIGKNSIWQDEIFFGDVILIDGRLP